LLAEKKVESNLKTVLNDSIPYKEKNIEKVPRQKEEEKINTNKKIFTPQKKSFQKEEYKKRD